ncbi:MAG: response regulator, partial [Gammaproteobacteria bacterium]|nr:response regulator [Gammaproteobacteria bacterium]
LKVVLGDIGVSVVTAENGRVALDRLASQDFDIVFMDVQMPEMDGYTAARLMREKNYSLPIIAMTADAMVGAEQKCLDAGYSEYMAKPIDIDLLVNRLAEHLSGEPVAETEAATLSPITADQAPALDALPDEPDKIVSSLPMTNPKFRNIVEKFVTRLGDQLAAIDSAWNQRDYTELKRLGHWLKGSAGSVGFTQFVEPARAFEQFAIDKADAHIPDAIQKLHSIYSRIDVEPEQKAQPVLEIVKPLKGYVIPEKLTSRYLETKPKLRPIIGKFISQLSARCDVVEAAVTIKDFHEIEKFGYWLKASGGSAGFSAFTEPARDLENYAKEKQLDSIKHAVGVIRLLNSRIVTTDVE